MVRAEESGAGLQKMGLVPREQNAAKEHPGPGLRFLTPNNQTLNDSPQPHSFFTFGLLNLKPSFRPSRA